MANGELDEESLQDLYSWVDAIPLSRPKKNITRDFSDGVLAAEVVKFYFPKMVEMHNYVPANSTQQKLSNWAHLNRKVLARLNFSIPEDVVRKVVQCVPGAVELVLVPLRQRIEEKQRKSKDLAWRSALDENSSPETDPGDQPSAAARDSALVKQEGEGYFSKPKANAAGIYQESSRAERTAKAQPGYAQALQGDPRAHLQQAEREQALLVARETVQILQMKVRRLEQLVQLKDIRIDDLTRRLQQKEK